MKKKFLVRGMTCASCQSHVQKAIEKLNGVKDVNVSLMTNSMNVDYDESLVNDELIFKATKKAGYEAYLPNEEKANLIKDDSKKDLIDLIISFVFLLLLMYVSMGHMINLPLPYFMEGHKGALAFSFSQFILVLPIVFIYRRYFISGFKKIFNLSPNMDSLIALGATASLIYGIYAIYMIGYGLGFNDMDIVASYHDNLYFESAGMILTLVSLGKYFEKISKKKTTNAISKLMDLAPKEACVLIDNEERIIPIDQVKLHDIVILKKGDAVPVDGIIIEGKATLNQANLTGENMPIYKTIGDEVLSSTIVNSGYLKIEASHVGEDTSIATIIRLVNEAADSKAPISHLVDKISFYFVPTIFVIALISFLAFICTGSPFEVAFNFSISTLVIACPCALGLATPLCIMIGTGKGAESGLLIKNAEILEKAHNINTIVLDKTGTITKGEPNITDFISYGNEDQIIDVLYSLESLSEHPLSTPLVNYSLEKKATLKKVEDFNSVEGQGINGIIDNDFYEIGNDSLLKENKEEILSLKRQGKTVLILLKNHELLAIIALKDEVKDTSKMAVSLLKKEGIKVIMLTGDNKDVASIIGKEVEVDEVISEVLPKDKMEVITSLKKKKKDVIAMVGDGVNDAPALTRADLGIALGSGSDIALETSDIILLRNDLMDVYNVIRLSKRVMNTIKISLFWAFIYNLIGVLLACGLFYPSFGIKLNPMIASGAMSFSSIFVVLTSLTLYLFKPKRMEGKKEIVLKEEKIMKSVTLKVDGMMCNNCKRHVETACKKVNNVLNAEASLENKEVVIYYEDAVDVNQVIKNIQEEGYDALVK